MKNNRFIYSLVILLLTSVSIFAQHLDGQIPPTPMDDIKSGEIGAYENASIDMYLILLAVFAVGMIIYSTKKQIKKI